jgi:hypothetical protein
VHLHELGEVKLGCLQDLDLADEGVLQGVDACRRGEGTYKVSSLLFMHHAHRFFCLL